MASESSRLPKLAERRQIQRTDLTSTSSRAASLEAALRENLILEQRLEAAAAGVTPQDSLRRLLSLKSIVSTSSSFAERHQAAVGTEAPFREIGTGSIGKVFEHPGTVWAYKLPLGDDASKLWNNYIINRMIEASFEQLGLLAGQAEVPRAVWYATPATNEFWDLNIDRFPYTTEFQRRPRAALCTERIFPLPAPIREALISLYCPQHAQESAKMYPANKDCLVRPLLGRRRHSTTSKLNSFSLRNFKLHLDQVEEIQLDVQEIAFAMADALAVLHWHTKIDALDIEFVLGSSPQEDQKIRRGIPLEKLTGLQTPQSTFEHVTNSHPNFRRRVTSLWLLDFDACSDISMDQAGVDKACRAFMETDPYFPRPQPGRDAAAGQLWTSFGQRYLATAAEFISAEHKALPERFLVGIYNLAQAQQRRQSSSEISSQGDARPLGHFPGNTRGRGTQSGPSNLGSHGGTGFLRGSAALGSESEAGGGFVYNEPRRGRGDGRDFGSQRGRGRGTSYASGSRGRSQGSGDSSRQGGEGSRRWLHEMWRR